MTTRTHAIIKEDITAGFSPHAYLFVDGSAGGKHNFGAWAAIAATVRERKILYGTAYPTTISRCELVPIIEGLTWIQNNWVIMPGFRVAVISDSEYTVKTLSGLYRKKKNTDLWAAADEAAKGLHIKYVWRERNSLPYMTYCDAICGSFREAMIAAASKRFEDADKPELDMPFDMLPDVSVPESQE